MPTQITVDLSALENEVDAVITAAEKHVPEEIKAFVDRAYAVWQDTPKKWREVALGSDDAVRKVTRLAREYAKRTERTFRTKATDDATKLVYKVSDKRKGADTSPEDGE